MTAEPPHSTLSAMTCLQSRSKLRLGGTVGALKNPVTDKVSELLGRRLDLILGLVVETGKKLVRLVVGGTALEVLARRLGAANLVLFAVVEKERKVLRPSVPSLLRVEDSTVAQHVGQGTERAARLAPRVVLGLLLNILVVRELLRWSASPLYNVKTHLNVERSSDAEVPEAKVGGQSSSLDLDRALGGRRADVRSTDDDARKKLQRALSRHSGDARREAKAQTTALSVS